ncbi:hypothetical protein Pint_10097 [Pistacia integerrima]|uniref:Uncharacterized protein n=1 Tax=Pistacia integerrima TaxID=434235 RepID=A0ACC0XFX3_9ROSI|nr:hypothetical protein Pint_10097 [Pistacia integerrima]
MTFQSLFLPTVISSVDKPWSEQFTGAESEDRDSGVFKSANGGEEEPPFTFEEATPNSHAPSPFQIVTNGTYPSIEHRATVNSMKERLSIATFYSPNANRDMGRAPSLITPENPPLFKRISVADYYKGFLSHELQGKSYLDVLRIKDEDESG